MASLSERIEAKINEGQLFRNPELTIKDVATELCTNRLYVSHAINTDFGMTFTQYINRKRIEYAIVLLTSYPMMRLNDVATESGLSSEKALLRVFKKVMNDSPRAYAKKIIKEKAATKQNSVNYFD